MNEAHLMDSVVPSDLAASLGAVQIGVFVSHVLFGVTTTQTYIYYSRFPEDSQKIKSFGACKTSRADYI
jgi:hypothetical protein